MIKYKFQVIAIDQFGDVHNLEFGLPATYTEQEAKEYVIANINSDFRIIQMFCIVIERITHYV